MNNRLLSSLVLIMLCLTNCSTIKSNAKSLKNNSSKLLVFSKSAKHAEKRRYPRDNKKFLLISENTKPKNMGDDNIQKQGSSNIDVRSKPAKPNFFSKLFSSKNKQSSSVKSESFPDVRNVPAIPSSFKAPDQLHQQNKQDIEDLNKELSSDNKIIESESKPATINHQLIKTPMFATKPTHKQILIKPISSKKMNPDVIRPDLIKNENKPIKLVEPRVIHHHQASGESSITPIPLPEGENLEIDLKP